MPLPQLVLMIITDEKPGVVRVEHYATADAARLEAAILPDGAYWRIVDAGSSTFGGDLTLIEEGTGPRQPDP